MGGGEVAEGKRRPTRADTVSGFYGANLIRKKIFQSDSVPIISDQVDESHTVMLTTHAFLSLY